MLARTGTAAKTYSLPTPSSAMPLASGPDSRKGARRAYAPRQGATRASEMLAMLLDGHAFMVDVVTFFHDTVTVLGWFHHPSEKLREVTIQGPNVRSAITRIGLDHGGVMSSYGPGKGFRVQALLTAPSSGQEEIAFRSGSGWKGRARLSALANELQDQQQDARLANAFIASVNANPHARVLDIGGRARSGKHYGDAFNVASYTVLDILPGENVDVVADAHRLADHFPPASFDAAFSVSVFEHLMMPWTVAVQMNRVLKPGGTALIASHQTLGMHDLPWDFWRFSDTAWDALFNRLTGFEVIDRAFGGPSYIIPHLWRPDKQGSENAVGYEGSAVWVRKIGESTLAWDAAPADLTQTTYPTGTDQTVR